MYLKSIEMHGFKSFSDKTKLEIEPGLTAIVGPNGCGKSNIADAFRWVLGEQSAKALRGSKMEDCIFNGTDERKPLGMAEVSVTFADCETTLGVDYNEVTVTRRVFRSGEGQYLLNKTPCRLKDIHRLFMGTGIGTTSYSMLEQGRIDQVLSQKPEDRRSVFEEASGITKFKTDKKEALRKLEYTDANLLRIADVIREVKRQIGSLQRQAGKARRYQELRNELRRLDIYLTQNRLKSAEEAILILEQRIAEISNQLTEAHAALESTEQETSGLRQALLQIEREIAGVLEAGVQAENRLNHARELIQVNHQRIDEYRLLADRDAKEIETHRQLVVEKHAGLEEIAHLLNTAKEDAQQAEATLQAAVKTLAEYQAQIESARAEIQQGRTDTINYEGELGRLQNELASMDARDRENMIGRERLTAEKSQLAEVMADFDQRQTEMELSLSMAHTDVNATEAGFQELEQQRQTTTHRLRELQLKLTDIQSLMAARQAQVEILKNQDSQQEDFSSGARWILDAENPLATDRAKITGTLVSFIDINEKYALALEAALRPWLDAIVVESPQDALDILAQLASQQAGAIRLVSAAADTAPTKPDTDMLISKINCPAPVRPVLEKLIGHVRLVEKPTDIPMPPPAGSAYVTPAGLFLTGDGAAELWMREAQASTPLSRKLLLDEARTNLVALQQSREEHLAQSAAAQEALVEIERKITAARQQLDTTRHAMAQKQGEQQMATRQANEARKRLETVTWELEALTTGGLAGDTQKIEISRKIGDTTQQRDQLLRRIQEQTAQLQIAEQEHAARQTDAADCRIQSSQIQQRLETLSHQQRSEQQRIAELEQSIAGRTQALQSYEGYMQRLKDAIATTQDQLASLETAVQNTQDKANMLRRQRDQHAEVLQARDAALTQKRQELETTRNAKSDLEIRISEARLRRQTQVDRVTSEYHLSIEQVMAEPSPEWETPEAPTLEMAETSLAEIRAKIEAMGPVNLVAIDEYKELEERFSFLTTQEKDLVNAKEQLLDMIRTINKTTSEMFQTTFTQININFQTMFTRLFNGGSARLELSEGEDVLECGIEIIARPPGKRLQNVSLLSGGERTLTAVALLFAIYMIKPSPFCLLDELDAPLDESNIGRFVNVLQDFLKQSQFVVISHNRKTIAAANILYGVTMPEKGVSKIVSMKFTHQPESQTATENPPPKTSFTPDIETPTQENA